MEIWLNLTSLGIKTEKMILMVNIGCLQILCSIKGSSIFIFGFDNQQSKNGQNKNIFH